MSQKGYIGRVVRKLNCTKRQKQEIKRQLEADLQTTLSGNETMAEIIERMGTVESVAKEFNDNFNQEELKHAKKEKRIKMLVIIILICAGLAGFVYWISPKQREFGSSGKFEAKQVKEQAEVIIDLINTDDYEGLQACSVETLQKMFAGEQLDAWKQAKAMIGNDWGAFVAFEESFMVEINQMGQNIAVISIKTTYENVSIVYQLSFDEELKLAGIFIR